MKELITYLKSYSDTYVAGIYIKKLRFLPVTMKHKLKLPIDMYKKGLVVLGEKESQRRDFVLNYTRILIKQGVNVIYITDSEKFAKLLENFVTLECHPGTLSSRTELLHPSCEIEDVDVAVYSTPESKHKDFIDGLQEQYDNELISLLERIADSDLGNKKTAIIIDESSHKPREIDKAAFTESIKRLQAKGVGIILSGNSGFRYDSLSKVTEYLITFKLYDPAEDLSGFESATNFYKMRTCTRDFTSIAPNGFHLFVKSIEKSVIGFMDKRE